MQINQVCKGYVTEIGWRDNKYIPSLEEHLKVTLVTCFYWGICCAAFVVFEENVTEELLKWMSKFPQIVMDSCIISRLMDDIVAHEVRFYFVQNSLLIVSIIAVTCIFILQQNDDVHIPFYNICAYAYSQANFTQIII